MRRDDQPESYFKEAASWNADRIRQAHRTARIAWWTAGGGWSCAVVTAAALLVLMPLKRVEPYVVRVDNTTGLVDVVPIYSARSDLPQTVTRYLLTHYVTVCERFTFSTAEADYEECGSFHTGARNQAWYALWTTSNPRSPLNLHKDGSSVRAQVKSVSFFARASGVADLAQVRYLKAQRPAGGAEEQLTHWIATIQYAYADPSQDPKIRRWNPLGFKIIDFKPEPEIVADAAPPTAALTGRSP